MDDVGDDSAVYFLSRHSKLFRGEWQYLAVLFFLLVSAFGASPAGDELDLAAAPARKASERVPGELIVRFKPGTTEPKKAQSIKKANGTFRDVIAQGSRLARAVGQEPASEQLKVVKVAGNVAVAKAALEKDPNVLYVEPNFKTHIEQVVPNDFEFDSLYAMQNTGSSGGKLGADIKATEAWGISTGSRDIVVAVVDTGIDYFHEDLRANIWTNPREIPGNGIDDDGNGFVDDTHGYDFVSSDSDPFDDHLHGTHVSGTIGAVGNNGIGVVGVCWQVRLMALKAFDDQGSGDVASAVAAIHYAIANDARIINASWSASDRSQALADAVADAEAAGVLFVAAAGNSHTSVPFYPAAYDSVLSVASVNNKDEMSPFTNFGQWVDIAAPGEQILSTIPDSRYDAISGTSMSTPHVSGAAALVLTRHPEFTPAQVRTILKNTADFVRADQPIGQGSLNVFNALQVDVPLPFATLKGPPSMRGLVTFTGIATGEHFQKYALSYGNGNQPTNWVEIFQSNSSVTNGVLFSGFDPSILDDGTYTFRLEVWNSNGQSAKDFTTVQVQNVELAFPLSSDIVRAGEPLTLRGTVFGQGRHFGLEWSRGLSQTQWFNAGFSIPSNGEVVNGPLGVFDTTLVSSNEFYSFRLSATNASGAVQQFTSALVWLDSRLRPGFPIYLPYEEDFSIEDWRQAKVADLDGDGRKEIVIVDQGNSAGKVARLLVFHDDGTLAWSRDLNADPPYTDVPTIGDLDGDGKPDILVDVGSTFYAFNRDGSMLPGLWPLSLNANQLGKILADVDGDGKMEVVALANSAPTNEPANVSLAIYDREGHSVQRWDVPAFAATNVTQRLFPVAANMDEDPDLEIIVVGGSDQVMMFDIAKPDGPAWVTPLQANALSSPVVGDLDRDGFNDIVVTTWAPSKTPAGVYRIDHKGVVAPGWPVLTDEAFSTGAALGDLRGDGHLEICVAGEHGLKLHVLEEDGFEAAGWPVAINTLSSMGSPGIADVDGDGAPDVIYAAPANTVIAVRLLDPNSIGGIAAWKRDGTPIWLNGDRPYSKMPVEGSPGYGFFKSSPLTITDLDGNGKMDVVGSSIRDVAYSAIGGKTAFKNRSSIYAWEFDAPATQTNPSWLEFQHGADNNGFLPTPKPLPQPPDILPIDDQIIAVGTPFPQLALDEYLFFPTEVIYGLTWTASGATDLLVQIDSADIAHVTAPTTEWEGSETITFSVTDGATFTRTVDVVFAAKLNFIPPIAIPDDVTAFEDTPIEIDVLANDRNPVSGTLQLVGLSIPLHGRVVLSPDGKASYFGATNYFGDDTFTYVVQNDSGAKAFGTVTIHVTPVNDPPIANNDRALGFENSAITIDAVANDKDAENDPITIVDVGPAPDGATSVINNKIVFEPKAGFNGTNVFSYWITDGTSAPQSATVTVVIRPLNTPPVAKPQSLVMNRNTTKSILYLGDDLEGDPLTFRIIRAPQHGELFSFPNLGSYTPIKGYSGADSFSYKASDGQLESAEATVNITILNTNNPPVVTALNLMTRVNQAVTINLSATDPDDDPVTFRLATPPAHGILAGNGSNYIYTPNLDYLGKDQFTYAVSDGTAETIGIVSLETTDKNTAPGANVNFVKTTPNTPVTIVLTGADAESNPLTFDLTSTPKHGLLSGDAPYLLYSPETNYMGPDRLRFTVSDGEFTSDPAAVTISVAPKNTLPTSTNQTVFIPVSGPGYINLAVHDDDGDPLQVVILKGPKSGRLFGTGTFYTYVPSSNFGFDVFTYKPWDGRNFGAEAQVRIEQSTTHSNPPPAFESIQIADGGVVQLSVTNQLGVGFRIETTSDFVNWTTVTNVTTSSGRFLFDAAPTDAQLFYRAIQ
jgi:subtilisin family serine protease